jgi:hypothetical protein
MPGVPNTTDFTLADVIAAVLPSSNDLNECFTDAIQGAFNYTYNPGGNQNTNLLNFRDYGNDIAYQNPVQINTGRNPGEACGGPRNIAAWKNRNPNSVQNGDKFWQDSSGSPGNPYPGVSTTVYAAFSGLNSVSFNLSSVGIASNVTFCSLPSLTLTDVLYSLSAGGFSTPVDYYYNSTIGNASNLGSGDIIYSDSSLTTPLSATQTGMAGRLYFQTGSTATTTRCTLSSEFVFVISTSTGTISAANCNGEQ